MAVLVGKKAPDFSAKAVINGDEIVDGFTLSQFAGKKYVILFFYPLDFTFVCPTEILAFQEKIAEFEQRNTQIIGVSVDSHHSHFAWLNTPKQKGGIEGVKYPLVADITKTIAKNYDVLSGDYAYEMNDDGQEVLSFQGGDSTAYRGLFLIDRQGVVRHQLVNDMPLGRSIDEAIRMVDALQFNEEKGEVCPANWEKGEEGLKATRKGIAEYLTAH